MRKLLELDELFPKTGEPTVQLAAWRGRMGGLSIEKRAFAESHSPAYDFLKTVQPEAGVTYILVNALGAWEHYDENRNGDGFNLLPFMVGTRAKCGHPECTASLDGWVSEPETLGHHYKSFEAHGGIYRHHVNKDPSKSLGTIPHAFLNPRMKRVELLLRYVDARDPEIPRRIGDGDFPAVSMGCHVRWDVCTICGHRAPTRAQYCRHALTQMRQILADGRKVCVLNPSPRFFDISFVFRPADPTGWTMLKAAHANLRFSAELGEALDRHEQIRDRFDRTAYEIRDAWTRPETLVGGYVRSIGAPKTAAAPRAVTAAVAHPRLLGQAEVAKLAAEAYGLSLPDHVVDRLVVAAPALVSLIGRYPEVFKTASFGPVGDVLRDRAFSPWTDEPTAPGPGAHYRAGEPPRSDLLTMTDPYTGHVYQTTRGAAMDAERSDVKSRLRNTAIFTGLYAAGLHHLLGGKALHTLAALPVAAGLGHVTERAVRKSFPPYRNPGYLTDQGVPVSGGTEFKAAALTPSAWAEKLAHDADLGATLERIGRAGGDRFLKWASLPLTAQTDALASRADRSTEHGASIDLDQLASNLVVLLTT